jgi:hypothetical protein
LSTILKRRFHTAYLDDLRTVPEEELPDAWDLKHVRDTLAARISDHRQLAGWTEHELCYIAQVPCRCAKCGGKIPKPQSTQPVEDLELAENPF